jgi:hypothetical protein
MAIVDNSDPKIDYKRLGELTEEFFQHWNHLQALYLDAVVGFTFVRQRVEGEQVRARKIAEGTELDSQEFQDTRIFSYRQIFSDEFVTSGIHKSTLGQARLRNSHDGDNFTALGQLCVTSFYDFWNDYLRREYVIAKGKLDPNEKDNNVALECMREHAKFDLWGDIGYLRASIVHNGGVAVEKVSRCKLIKWFAPGDRISITPDRMRALFLALLNFRNQLDKERYPEHTFTVTEYPDGAEPEDRFVEAEDRLL